MPGLSASPKPEIRRPNGNSIHECQRLITEKRSRHDVAGLHSGSTGIPVSEFGLQLGIEGHARSFGGPAEPAGRVRRGSTGVIGLPPRFYAPASSQQRRRVGDDRRADAGRLDRPPPEKAATGAGKAGGKTAPPGHRGAAAADHELTGRGIERYRHERSTPNGCFDAAVLPNRIDVAAGQRLYDCNATAVAPVIVRLSDF
jgi:hypothetical protein